MINAADSLIGQKYKTTNDILVEVVAKHHDCVVVRSFETGHSVTISRSYKLLPVFDTEKVETDVTEDNMSNETPVVAASTAAPKAKKLKKSNVVDDGLKAGLALDEIVKNVLAAFPETPEKSIRNLISVRRSKLKKTA